MTWEQAEPAPTAEMNAETQRLFYHTYIDHYGIAEHYVAGDLAPDDLEEFAIHLEGCQECADRVLLAEMFRDQSPKRRGSVKDAISESVREIVEEAHESASTLPFPPEARPADRPARTPVLAALAHSKKLGAVPPPLPKQIRSELKATAAVETPAAVAPTPVMIIPTPIVPAKTVDVKPVAKHMARPMGPLPVNAFLCTYDADRRGCRIPSQTAGGVSACPLPLRARWVASFSPLQLFLLGGATAMVLLAIPAGLFLFELNRLSRN